MIPARSKKQLFDEALAWLEAEGIQPERPTEHQIKVGAINYYPGKGTIYLDGAKRICDEKGLEGLITILRRYGYLSNGENVVVLGRLHTDTGKSRS